jgi:signal peptidase I
LIAPLVGCAIGALVVNTWIVQGLFAPLVVSGGSMAPALRGAHRQWQCRGCGLLFACDLQSLPAPGASAVCPHCGAANDPARGADLPGDRLLVDRSAFLWRPPRRWERVVFRSPENPDVLCVKRVVGLPGEVIDIVGGDVLVDGAVARKSPAAQRALAVSVSNPAATDRWRGGDATAWRQCDGGFVHDAVDQSAVDWLSYHHAEHAARGPRQPGQPILDDSTYDQNESRRLNEVADVMLCLEVQASGSGSVHLRATYRNDAFQARLDVASGRIDLVHNGRLARRVAGNGSLLQKPTAMEFVVADRCVQLAIAGRTRVQYDYEPAAAPSQSPRGLAVGSQNARVRARSLRVLRDIYYTADAGSPQYRLGDREYFLLGDNSPHSLDSRVWSGGISRRLLLGPALCW